MTELPEDLVYARHSRRTGSVLIVGTGAVGGFLAEELARLGVSPLHLVDKDILKVENLVRHPLGAGEVGQPKAPTLAKKIRRDFPCEAIGYDDDFLHLPRERQVELARNVHVVVAATDEVDCQHRVNEVCFDREVRKPAVFPALWVDDRVQEAEVGEILWTLPSWHTPCYRCAVDWGQIEGAAQARGTRSDIQVVVLATAQVVAALLDLTNERSRILDADRTCFVVHGFSPLSPGIRDMFGRSGLLQSRAVHVPFPRTPCPACGGRESDSSVPPAEGEPITETTALRLADIIARHNELLAEYGPAIGDTRNLEASTKASLRKISKALREIRSEVEALRDQNQTTSAEAERLRAVIRQVQVELEEYGSSIETTNNQLQDLNAVLGQLKTSLDDTQRRLLRAIQGFGGRFDTILDDLRAQFLEGQVPQIVQHAKAWIDEIMGTLNTDLRASTTLPPRDVQGRQGRSAKGSRQQAQRTEGDLAYPPRRRRDVDGLTS